MLVPFRPSIRLFTADEDARAASWEGVSARTEDSVTHITEEVVTVTVTVTVTAHNHTALILQLVKGHHNLFLHYSACIIMEREGEWRGGV